MVDDSSPYQLYWHETTSSLAPMAVLEEIGAEYEPIEIDVASKEHKGAAFRKIHPLGLMPALRLPDGRTVFESAGIAMFLADRHPEASLAPNMASADRAFYNQWLFFLADTVFPAYGRYYKSADFSMDPGDNSRIKELGARLLINVWEVVERALDGREWLVGSTCTAADIYMLMLTTWDDNPTAFQARCPNIVRVSSAAANRPGIAKALARHVNFGA